MPIASFIPLCLLQFCAADSVRESNRRGVERFSTGDLLGAVRLFEDALPDDSACNVVRTNLVVACLHAGRFDEALRRLRELSGRDPDDPCGHYLSGVLHMRRGRADQAAALDRFLRDHSDVIRA